MPLPFLSLPLMTLFGWLSSGASPFSTPELGDSSANLVDELRYETLSEMRDHGLEHAAVPEQPWSGWYWPLYEGGLAYRYADPDFPKEAAAWEEVERFLTDSVGRGPIENYSPAEKYDLLLGNSDFTFTRNMILLASDYASGGRVAPWIGYCTGWASASMMMRRPARTVTVFAADGKTRIPFRPDDIKALGTLLWANGSSPSRIAGSLCQENPVERDPTTERPLNARCRDTNPATWHVSVVNQIGIARRALLIESDPGYQVWNQPVQSYAYHYFNPITEKAGSLEQSTVRRSDFKKDRFAAFRSPESTHIVGIEMQLTFIYETRPTPSLTDSPKQDQLRVPTYRYDLELDASGRIIGGEWITRLHPDLLWVSGRGSFPVARGDLDLQNDTSIWTPNIPLPAPWIRAANQSLSFTQPLGRIVKNLFEWSAR